MSATDELFDCVDVLSPRRENPGPRLAIIANGRGPAVLALDRLHHDKGELAKLSDNTRLHLRALLPDYVKTTILCASTPDLQPQQLTAVANLVLQDEGVDALFW